MLHCYCVRIVLHVDKVEGWIAAELLVVKILLKNQRLLKYHFWRMENSVVCQTTCPRSTHPEIVRTGGRKYI